MSQYRSRRQTPCRCAGTRCRRLLRGDPRQGRKRTTVSLVAVLLVVQVSIVGCGSAADDNNAKRQHAVAPGGTTRHRSETSATKELDYLASSSQGTTLAGIGLPGGAAIRIAAIRCLSGQAGCYEFAAYREVPAKHASRMSGKKYGRVNTGIVGTGPSITQAGPAERTILDMIARHGCAGSYVNRPYAVVYGLLRGVKDIVTAQAGGRTISVKKASIPSRMHPEGVLVYGLLLPGANEVVVRTPGGRDVSKEFWPGSNEEVSCRAKY